MARLDKSLEGVIKAGVLTFDKNYEEHYVDDIDHVSGEETQAEADRIIEELFNNELNVDVEKRSGTSYQYDVIVENDSDVIYVAKELNKVSDIRSAKIHIPNNHGGEFVSIYDYENMYS